MNLLLSALLILGFSNAQMSFAQTSTSETTSTDTDPDPSHDLPSNDPSVGNMLTLSSPLPQRKIVWHGVNHHINQNIRSSFHHTKAVFRKRRSKEELKDQDLFQLFKIHQYRYEPKKEYGPATVNANHEYKGISDREFGFCWGYSTLARYFTTLAFFDPSLPKETNLDLYKEKIDEVLAGNATVIPGFANFREFSLVPELEFYLKLNAMELWKTRAVRPGSIGIFKNATKEMKSDEVEDLLVDLEARLARNELPKILFSSLIPSHKVLGLNADIHAVLVYKVERLPNHAAKIYIWDINYYTETLVREPKFLEITPDHGILFAPWYEPHATYAAGSAIISRAEIAPENDAENIQMLNSLKEFCSAPETATYCAGARVD